MAEVKKNTADGNVPDAADVQALKAQVDTLTVENTSLRAKVQTHEQTIEGLQGKKALDAAEIDQANEVIDELKARIAGYEAAPQTDGSGRKIHTLKGTKRKFQLVFPTQLDGELVNDDAISADNGKLAELVKMESGAIQEVG